MEASQDIRSVIADWFAAVAAGDAGWRDRHVSTQDSLRIIGTDPEEWLDGARAYAFLADEARSVSGKLRIELPSVEGYAEGSVGWGAARPEITLGDGRIVSPRWSAVFHREAEVWTLVQLHASIAIGNEIAFGDTFSVG
jgi:ketosteroid isomerase-like protein